MQDYKDDRTRGSAAKQGALLVFRALRSTLVIGVVAVVVAAVRSGKLRWEVIVRLGWSYRVEFAMIFMGLLVWDYWFRRAQRQRVGGVGVRDVD